MHAGDNRAGHVDQAIHIGAPHAFHLRVIEIQQIAAPGDTGIVHQDRDRAELLLDPFHHVRYRECVSHVGACRQCTSARAPNLRHHGFRIAAAFAIIDRY